MGATLTLSIGIGLVLSLLFSELLGIAVGGMVVPGYLALYLDKPVAVLATLASALLTYFIVQALSGVMIIYGRRRTVLMIIIGFMFGHFIRSLSAMHTFSTGSNLNISVIGYIIPGLIAIWFDRQGIIQTLSALIVSTVMVRLLLILITGGDYIL
ncbi:poly-gamma-glutamate biosynthesis protein PgsC [Myxococcota bacterium]|nr:poly-gamma-glutamate biosynthesis protein PgsC [Myxococcota bacterium]MBU1536878.1 poly-gamma-glutamate biosynthesis protein PgsC [Myxococcota bacterium]